MKEIWKDVLGYEGCYKVSNLGRIESLPSSPKKKNIILKPKIESTNKGRYKIYSIYLYQKGIRKYFKVHRIVALAFIPNPKNKEQINHLDNNPLNNKVVNLEWATRLENKQWSVKQGRHYIGG